MSLTGPLNAAAAYAGRLHSATCTITRPDPDSDQVFDDGAGTYVDPPPVAVYSGACLLVPTGGERVQDFGEGPVVTRTYMLEIGDTSTTFKVGDDVTIDTARDPRAVGMTLDVLDVPKSELVTVRRLTAEERL